MNITDTKIRNSEMREILSRYAHYEYMTYDDFKAFKDYLEELRNNASLYANKFVKHTLPANALKYLNVELTEMEYINKYKIYTTTMVSLFTMNGLVRHIWEMDSSGYHNNPFFDFQKLVKRINCYWKIENPTKAPNKVAWGLKFCLEKGDKSCFYKGCRLYLFGCIRNYLKQNGINFTKEESLKVRKLVGLADIYDTTE